MEYNKQNFVKGQILKADHLNYMEDGIVSLNEEMAKQYEALKGKQPAGDYALKSEIPKVFHYDAKVLLVEILRSGAYSEDVSDKITEFAKILNMEGSPELAYSGFCVTGSVYFDVSGGFVYSTAKDRRTIVTSDGAHQLRDELHWGASEYSLCQIPAGARSVIISAPSECAYYGVQIGQYDAEGKPSRIVDSGWMPLSDGCGTYTILSDYADGNYYIGINLKNASGSAFSDDFDNAAVKMAFQFE